MERPLHACVIALLTFFHDIILLQHIFIIIFLRLSPFSRIPFDVGLRARAPAPVPQTEKINNRENFHRSGPFEP